MRVKALECQRSPAKSFIEPNGGGVFVASQRPRAGSTVVNRNSSAATMPGIPIHRNAWRQP
jgi:hypothetical protein